MAIFNLFSRRNKSSHAATNKDLTEPVATPAEPYTGGAPLLTGVRNAVDTAVAGGWTPSRLAQLLADAKTLQSTSAYFSLAEELEERDTNYRSVISTRKLAVSSLPIVVEPASDRLRDRKVAEFVKGVMDGPAVRGALFDLADAISKGIAVLRVDWKQTATEWTPSAIEWIDPRWVAFDRKDGRTPYLMPDIQGAAAEPLQPYRFLVHTPKLKSGIPVRNGLAAPAAWLYIARGMSLKEWLGFLEMQGKPVRLGKYGKNASPQEIDVLKRAVANIGTDAAAVLPDSMLIEFIKDATISGTSDAYESLNRYCDEGQSRLVLGGNLTSGTSGGGGGTFAQAKVHNEVRWDIMKADAKDADIPLMQLTKWLVELNFGEGTALPNVHLQVEEPEDLSALVSAVEKLVPLGLEVSKDELRGRLGLRTPKEGEPVLAPAAQPAPADTTIAPASNAVSHAHNPLTCGCPVHDSHAAGSRDAMDDLADAMYSDWEQISAGIKEELTAVAMTAESIDDLAAKLAKHIKTADMGQLLERLAVERTKTRTAGKLGADV